jgi:hypothetical protein
MQHINKYASVTYLKNSIRSPSRFDFIRLSNPPISMRPRMTTMIIEPEVKTL